MAARVPAYVSLLVWATCLHLVGIWIFTGGFLLRRQALPHYSQCDDAQGLFVGAVDDNDRASGIGCWAKPSFKRSIILVVDALRFDFADYYDGENPRSYQNKLPIFHKLLEEQPFHTLLYKFVAHAPTTTMQRLKGLTTGGLPTFIDAGSNFASSQIDEDNLMHQLATQNRNLVFMGDDTWEGLFPNTFNKSYPYPSFNVRDLHTVDDGVVEHLLPEIAAPDWDVIVAHFLGVDHCGHRFGPNHHAMTKKLEQMNRIIKSTVEAMDENTLLLVFGDHGMTREGDHGGDSRLEVDSALFAYSKKPLHASDNGKHRDHVLQIDLVPTISMLLGVPIPFGSLGMAIPEFFTLPTKGGQSSPIESMTHQTDMIRVNAFQVHRYLKTYSESANDLPQSTTGPLFETYHHAETAYLRLQHENSKDPQKWQTVRDQYSAFLQRSRIICQDMWTTFNLWLIVAGISILSFAVIALYVLGNDSRVAENSSVLKLVMFSVVGAISGACVSLVLRMDESLIGIVASSATMGSLATLFLPVLSGVLDLFKMPKRPRFSNLESIIAFCSLAMHILGVFSNSFIVYEDSVTLFLFTALLVTIGMRSMKDCYWGGLQRIRTAIWFFVGAVAARGAMLGRACREEHGINCTPAALSDYVAPWVLFLFFVAQFFLFYRLDNVHGLSRYRVRLLPVFFLCVLTEWMLEEIEASQTETGEKHLQRLKGMLSVDVTAPEYRLMSAQILYVMTLVFVGFQIVLPLTALPEVTKGSDGSPIMNVHGGITFFSGPILSLVTTIAAPMVMLLSPRGVVGLFCGFITGAAILEIASSYQRLSNVFESGARVKVLADRNSKSGVLIPNDAESDKQFGQDAGSTTPWCVIILWMLAQDYFFYTTYHQATLPSIRVTAGLVGLSDANLALSGLLIALETMASTILFSLGLPLLFFWPEARQAYLGKTPGHLGDANLFWRKETAHYTRLFQLATRYMCLHGIRLTVTCLGAAIHRRHLMVWKIFGPRMLFDAFATVVVDVCVLISFLFAIQIGRAIDAIKPTSS